MINKKMIGSILAVAIIHFLITSVIAFYIGIQIGNQVGLITARGLQEASGKTPYNSNEDASNIYQKMIKESADVSESWKIPLFLISLPAKPIMNPILNTFGKRELNRVNLHEITEEQFRTRLIITHYTANFLNSLSFGLLVYIMLILFNKYRRKR